jgi:hypothetical protein
MQFPALCTEQDTGCRRLCTTRRNIRFPGGDTLLQKGDTKSYLPRGPDTRQTCDLIYVEGTRGIYVPLRSAAHADPNPDFSNYVRSAIVL